MVIAVWSGYKPKERFTWWLEVTPAIVGLILVIATYPRFKFTKMNYVGIWVQATLMFIGGHYTYAEVPLFDWIKDALDLLRNHFDRVGHFVQGFCPALIARELLIRTSPLRPGKWLFFIATCVCLFIRSL